MASLLLAVEHHAPSRFHERSAVVSCRLSRLPHPSRALQVMCTSQYIPATWLCHAMSTRLLHMRQTASAAAKDILINYYLRYLPGGVTIEDARRRLTTIACNASWLLQDPFCVFGAPATRSAEDMTSSSVTTKLIFREHAMQRIRDAIEPEKAAMTCFNSTEPSPTNSGCLGTLGV